MLVLDLDLRQVIIFILKMQYMRIISETMQIATTGTRVKKEKEAVKLNYSAM